ncbi:tRNA synthetases class I (E and q), catalytic domain-containing protein [Hirsutella rhossiliensis]|uniref:Glutamate--tRNA ligase, mitochondrial n=1 Tax=Hirsutella rhossiliensis TaxID=111463 RepID=A0A9P8SGN3_9HYPO|nr:tRNA synthetases class I (E and q), catalytic domain-containing protein [Hirsutella rhossiliensis]KAH0960126.1 tRNA synthetases class I (E and q), catalytic domain-containing protein [Hirsutella rhossiliensis]
MTTVIPRLSSPTRRRWWELISTQGVGRSVHVLPRGKLCCRLTHRESRAAITGLEENGGGSSSKTQRLAIVDSSKTGQAASGLRGLRNKRSPLRQPPGHASTRTILGQSSDLPIRARFAPSPTGYLHLGSLRTALFNNLVSRASKGGAFVLRIEDTDQSRLVEDAEERVIQDLEWAGLSWDEGPDRGGPHGPYRQSERLPIYRHHVQKLVDTGHAYRCFCTSEQLESQKRRLHDAGKPTIYPGTCRSIDRPESDGRASKGEPHVVRLKGDAFGRPKFRDAIYGHFQKKNPEDDFVILKTDGFPTYHLANVVDDHLMEITHVIRGEEWLISTPKHLALYQAFGWHPPTFAHLGLLVNPDGTKLSKRNDSASLSKYQHDRVFPMAFLSWLANLGSSFKSNAKTPRTLDDVVDALTFKFTTGGIKMNFGKLDYCNSRYQDALLANPIPELAEEEARLFNQHLIQPLFQRLDTITGGDSVETQILPKAWQTSLELVPALRSDEARDKYARDVFTNTQGGRFNSPSTLIEGYPFLFWRVPTDLYKSSIAAAVPNPEILVALDGAIERTECWEDQGGHVVAFLNDALRDYNITPVVMHNVLRLVATGAWDSVTPTSSKMFALLGRDEWRCRLDALKALLGEAS